MIQQFKYKNLHQQTLGARTELDPELVKLPPGDGSLMDKREELRQQYGWQSPYEYYYESGTDSPESLSPTMTTLEDIEGYGKDLSSEAIMRADKSSIPNYFWCETLSNWCYFKVSSYNPTFKKEYSWAPGWVRALLAIATFGMTEIINDISTDGFTLASLYRIPLHIVTAGPSAMAYLGMQVAAWMTSGADLAEKYGEVTLPLLLYQMAKSSSEAREADVDAESFVEYVQEPDKADQNQMPRSCVSLYMWNGYTRSWISPKSLIDRYAQYYRRLSRGFYQEYFSGKFREQFIDGGTGTLEERISRYLDTVGLTEEGKSSFMTACLTHSDDPALPNMLREICFTDTNNEAYSRSIARQLTMGDFYLDPEAFDILVGRTPLNKQQIVGVWNKDSSSWAERHYLENWGRWIPLTRDSATVRMFADRTFQIYNKAYSYVKHDARDNLGWIHKVLGHPCFFRGSDDVLWMAYWIRWTTGYEDEKRDKSLFTETTTMSGVYDISTDDIDTWDAIIEEMFDRHDDYGFSEWLVNGDYGVDYEKFTVDQEIPSEILTFESSELNPDKSPLVNTIDRGERHVMKLTLSSGTVIARDDLLSPLDRAKKW